MSDLGLFALGLCVGALAPAFGLFAGPALILALSILSGFQDGKRHRRLRRVWSWAPGLLGLLVVPLFLMSILKEQLYGPQAAHHDITLPLVLTLLSTVAIVFVAVAIGVSAVTRYRLNRAARH